MFNYVQGDTGPQIQLAFTDGDNDEPTDLRGATVTLHFRAVGSTDVLFSLPVYVNPETAANGVAIIQWRENDLNVEPGTYEGEIEVVHGNGGLRETLFDTLRFRIREDFA